MRATTLATFEVVSTVPETVSPPCATGVLIDIEMMRGGASGGSRTIGCLAMFAGAIVEASMGISRGGGVDPARRGAAVGPEVACGLAVAALAGLGEGFAAVTGDAVAGGAVAGVAVAGAAL